MTGIKFMLFVAPGTRQPREILKAVYELYADYAMKNPYYELDQRIKSPALRDMLSKKVAEFEARLAAAARSAPPYAAEGLNRLRL